MEISPASSRLFMPSAPIEMFVVGLPVDASMADDAVTTI